MAAIHAAAFTLERPWSEKEIRNLLASPHVDVFAEDGGFALARTVAGESELLTLAVHPEQQGRGIGRKLTRQWLETAKEQAEDAFLEVSSDNTVARALYQTLDFHESGLRKGYYAREDGLAADAVLMRRRLTFGHDEESPT